MPQTDTAAVPEEAPKFDDLMLALDAVDTIRHETSVLESELASGDRREALKARLREYYAGQGIDVSDEVLETAVRDMDKNRFVHEPLKPGLASLLATVYVRRVAYGVRAGVAACAVAAVLVAYPVARHELVDKPRERAAAELELTFRTKLPAALGEAYAKARAAAEKAGDGDALSSADSLKASAERFIEARDAAGAGKAIDSLGGIGDGIMAKLAGVALKERFSRDREELKSHAIEPKAMAALTPFIERMGTASASGDEAGYSRAKDGLDALLQNIMTPLELRIVDRTGTRSGVWRTNDGGSTKVYYLIVEAIDPAGRAVPMDIRSVETGRTQAVTTWGIRVPQREYDRVAQDKKSDGIIDDREAGAKPAGSLDFKWSIPVMDGQMITAW